MFSHFIYDGIPSDYYDVIACWVESNLDGVEPAGMQTDTSTQFAKRGSVFNIVQQSYNKPIEFKIQLINKDATHIDILKERELKKWLCKRGEYRWMQIFRDGYEDLCFMANFSNPKYIYYGGVCGLEFQVITNSPHMFSPLIKKKFNITDNKKTVNLYIENDEDDYVYPNVKIKMNQSGALTIRNSSEVEHREFRVENTQVGEEIYMDSSLPDISAMLPAAYDGIAVANEENGIACCSDEGIATTALTYKKTYLYKRGDECTSISGGWNYKAVAGGSMAKYSDNLHVSYPEGSQSMVYTNKKFSISELTSYTKLYCKYSYDGTDRTAFITPFTEYDVMGGGGGVVESSSHSQYFTSGGLNTENVAEMNTSWLASYASSVGLSQFYIGVMCVPQVGTTTLKIHEIWFESDELIEDEPDNSGGSGDSGNTGSSSGGETPPTTRPSGKTDALPSDVSGTVYLYKNGDECKSVTGGWFYVGTNQEDRVTAYKRLTYLEVKTVAGGSSVNVYGGFETVNYVMPKQRKYTVNVKYSFICDNPYTAGNEMYFSRQDVNGWGNTMAEKTANSATDETVLTWSFTEDNTNYTGDTPHCIEVGSIVNNASYFAGNPNANLKIYEIWVEFEGGNSGGDSGDDDEPVTPTPPPPSEPEEDLTPDANGRKLLYNYGVTSSLVGSWSIHTKNANGIAEERKDHLYFHTNYDSGNFIDTYACMITSKKINMSKYAKVGIRYDYNGVSNIAYTGIQPVAISMKEENSPTSSSDIMPFFAYGDEVNKIQRMTLYGHETGTHHLSFMLKTDNVKQPVTNMPLTFKIYQIWLEIEKEEADDGGDSGDTGGSGSGGSDGADWDEPFVPINAYPNIYHEFNKNWIRFVDGRNTLTFNLNCEIEFEYREIRKVGILS